MRRVPRKASYKRGVLPSNLAVGSATDFSLPARRISGKSHIVVCTSTLQQAAVGYNRHWRVMLLFSKLNAFGSATKKAS